LTTSFSRREFLSTAGKAFALLPVASYSYLQSCGGGRSSNSQQRNLPPPYQGTDAQLLDEIEQTSFNYFWEQAHPATGLVKDRAKATGTDNYTAASIAAVGFGLSALCIGDARAYQPSVAIQQRVITTLNTFLNSAAGNQGFFYHFLDWSTGQRMWNCELSTIDTALLLCGVLTARKYFASNQQIVDLATQIYNRANWSWFLNGGATLSMGWKPESGFLSARWEHYCELMMIYLLGMGSPTYPLPTSSWSAWTRPTYTYQGITYISAGDPLFTHQYSHAWYDFRNKHDAYADYFQNSVKATQAHKAFCLSLNSKYPDYADDLWGITASDSANGYQAWGGPPAHGTIDGTIVPCAAGGSIPFLYADCMKVLRRIRGSYAAGAWGRYGLRDAFNPLTNWYNPDVLGIDLGITMLMAENQRTGLIWNTFMSNPEAQQAMQLAGFVANS
jgi:hypothetical protein